MARRDKGSGSVTERSPGVYRMRVYVGRDMVTGTHRYASKTIKAKNVTEARKELGRFMAEQESEPVGSNATVNTLMAAHIQSLENKRRAPRTIATARRSAERIDPILGAVPINRLTGTQIDQVVAKYEDLEPSSIRRYLADLSAALGYAVQQGWLETSPMVRASVPPLVVDEKKVPDRATVHRLIAAVPPGPWQAATALAAVTGMRCGELCGLWWSDIDETGITVRRSAYRLNGETGLKVTKGKKGRYIPMNSAVATVLASWLGDRELPADSFVFSVRPDHARPLNPDTLSAYVSRAAADIGRKGISLHSLRHFGATGMLAQGIGVRDVAEILGHKDGGRLALQVYGHATDERQRAASEAMARALGPG